MKNGTRQPHSPICSGVRNQFMITPMKMPMHAPAVPET